MKYTSRSRTLRATLLLPLALGFAALATWGQGQARHSPMYNPKTETTFAGVVQEVKEVPGRGHSTGTHLIVKGEKETMEVHVGPTWFLKEKDYSFSKGDQIEVTGSKVQYAGAEVIVARQIKKGDATWTLRNDQGIPLWSHQGHRP